VISFGVVGCDTRSPEVQTRVDTISPWVVLWINAVESGAPPPEVFVPELRRLPKMSFQLAKFLAWKALAADFRQRFLQGRFKEINCRRINREKVKCLVFWYHARKVYTGSITPYLSLPREGSIWSYRFRIRRYDVVCWAYSRRPSACPRTLFYR
jgi:hypothetical protein